MPGNKKNKITLFALGAIIIILPVVIFYIWLSTNIMPVSSKKKLFDLEIKKGATFKKVFNTLHRNKIIRSPLAARFIRWINKYKLKAGYYRISSSMSLKQILKTLDKGKEHLLKITFPEGVNASGISAILERKNFLTLAREFKIEISNKKILSRYKIPFETAEGYLFPSTYFIPKNITAKKLVEKMIQTFFQKNGKAFKSLNPEIQKQVIIMASIIEKEAVVDKERALVASVFYNRLKRKMLFESCATVIYVFDRMGITKKRLLYRDLKVSSPFNTYMNRGLPPSPIANPGIASVKAAINPAKTNFLYFVYKGNGKHHFSRTLTEHNRAKRNYKRYILKKKN